ncbi:uncharacterized protein TNCV_2439101 [Trichonephila clavipes]|nr:uncharacterized protein TNCV_2439101 [Trichonephila clavipes]
MCAPACETYINLFSPSPPICALVEKWREVHRKRFVFPSLQKRNLLSLCNECSVGHFRGHLNNNARFWSLENPHEMLELLRDSPKSNVFCSISQRKVYQPFFFGEPTVTISFYLYALQLWIFPQLKKSEPELHLAEGWHTVSLASHSTRLVKPHCGFSANGLMIISVGAH